MGKDAATGFAVVAIALLLIGYLVAWSRASIDRVARKKLHSAREILRERNLGG